MSWIAVLLIGVAVADLAHAVRPVPVVDECVGAAAAVLVGLAAGLTEPVDVAALVTIAAVVILWGQTVTRGFGRGPAWLPLLVIAVALAGAVAVSGKAAPVGGLVADWLDTVGVPVLEGVDPTRFLLLAAVFLVQLSTGNVVVRLVLTATGTMNPSRRERPAHDELPLKGGRLLGPMERVFILGLGLAGQLTAASIVIAAKGLLRFPELQSKEDQARIHQVTEYFLVGSFASWLLALGSLVLLAP
ncbi:hypothetical protein [Nocardioides taihuensis]|uniref:GAP family protein n=1 Tax=Nocardioides taihuensis TaxID=1835606 RepID=A0ABW0BJR8_9ACTN